MKRYPYCANGQSMSFECNTGAHGRCKSAACDCWCHIKTIDDVIDAVLAAGLEFSEIYEVSHV